MKTTPTTFEDHIFEFKLFLFHLSSNKPHPQKSHLLKSQSVYKEGGILEKSGKHKQQFEQWGEDGIFVKCLKKVAKFISA